MLARTEAEMVSSNNGLEEAWKIYEVAQMHVNNGEYEDASDLLGQVLESLYY